MCFFVLKVQFFFKTDGVYPRDAGVFFSFTMTTPGSSLRFNTHWSAPPVSALARSGGPRKISQSPVSRNSHIERRMDRPNAVVGVIRGVASMCPVFCGQVLTSTESATSWQSTTSQCLSALPGRLGTANFVLDGLTWKDKNQRTYYYITL